MEKQSIQQIEQQLAVIKDHDDPFIALIEIDDRKGVQQLLRRWKRKKEQEKQLHDKFIEMNSYETKYRLQGYNLIAGVDEVGRGPLAGPVVAAAVILPDGFFLPGIDDSKKLSEKKREEYEEIIKREAVAISVAMIDAEEIDQINIYESTKKAMGAAIASLNPLPEFLLIDAMKLDTPFPTEAIIKGDAKSISIAAASIIAKTARDRLMKELSLLYPLYGFEKNMGYGTKTHIDAIMKNGITPYHRKSFAPVKDFV
ncbi:ribonuclease HII [Neobacillus sp. PS3-34]|uniref:ribonuclease HII n=1 Tax=Neobacillus sp. PS3-34 TaxID=3070678 RepID=UPI0027DFF264|nr:ribonuclease HII [Neobacillus sp. PS3-34]WML49294.1 ribonuclease HII [Neobacillus sp. PS3-34]